jgi:hypothetical protein
VDTALTERRDGGPAVGYWCECLARPRGSTRTFRLGCCPAASPGPALAWLRGRAREVAEQLHPAHALPVLRWLADEAERRRILAALARGEPYGFTAADDTTRYVLSARPGPAAG